MTFFPAAASGGSSFVYQEGGTPSASVFTTWAAAVAAAEAVAPAECTITVDGSFGTPNAPSSGAFNYHTGNVNLRGLLPTTTLTFANGAVCDQFLSIENITLVNNSALPVVAAIRPVAIGKRTTITTTAAAFMELEVSSAALHLYGCNLGAGTIVVNSFTSVTGCFADSEVVVDPNFVVTVGFVGDITQLLYETGAQGFVLGNPGYNATEILPVGTFQVISANTTLSQAPRQYIALNSNTPGFATLQVTVPSFPNDGDEIIWVFDVIGADPGGESIGAQFLDAVNVLDVPLIDTLNTDNAQSAVDLIGKGHGGTYKFNLARGTWELTSLVQPGYQTRGAGFEHRVGNHYQVIDASAGGAFAAAQFPASGSAFNGQRIKLVVMTSAPGGVPLGFSLSVPPGPGNQLMLPDGSITNTGTAGVIKQGGIYEWEYLLTPDGSATGPVWVLRTQAGGGDITPLFRMNHNGGVPYVLDTTQPKNLADVSGGTIACTLALGAPDSFSQTVTNSAGDASVSNITVSAPAGDTIESLSAPGVFGASSVINIKSASVTWQRDAVLLQWKIV